MVDSGAGMSGTSSTINLKDTMRCKIPMTPAFRAVMNATSEGLISDPTFKGLGIKAIHIEGQCFVADTFACGHTSHRGFKYCDVMRDGASQMIFCNFEKSQRIYQAMEFKSDLEGI